MRTAVLCTTLAYCLALTSPARAEETTTGANEPQRTAWPIVLGASGVALAGTSAYFFMHWNELQDRGQVISQRVPKDEAPCSAGGDSEFCSVEKRASLASALVITTGVASLAAFGSAIALYVIEGKPSRTSVAPVVAPGYGGAALVTSF